MERQYKIITNKIRCKVCGEILESKHVHDWVPCKCFIESGGKDGCFCDGGLEYRRRGGDLNMYEELSEVRPYTDEEVDEYNRKQEELAEMYDWMTVDYMDY